VGSVGNVGNGYAPPDC